MERLCSLSIIVGEKINFLLNGTSRRITLERTECARRGQRGKDKKFPKSSTDIFMVVLLLLGVGAVGRERMGCEGQERVGGGAWFIGSRVLRRLSGELQRRSSGGLIHLPNSWCSLRGKQLALRSGFFTTQGCTETIAASRRDPVDSLLNKLCHANVLHSYVIRGSI